MKKSRLGKGWSRRGYHHGNLREALISVARQLILEKGTHGFSLVEAARGAGVSPGAPYRHFKSRETLIAEIARRGFEDFTAKLEEAWADGRPDPATALRRMGRAYLQFAQGDRASYTAMFGADLGGQDVPELGEAGRRAFQVLNRASVAVLAATGDGLRITPETISTHIWALSHGVATLFRNKVLSGKDPQTDPFTILDTGVTTYLTGLGLSV